jgi:hypothetical protein
MVNRPKAIGTQFETDLARYLQSNGFPDAERKVLHGRYDIGDVASQEYNVAFEAKAGQAAVHASESLLQKWMEEADVERRNGGWHYTPLVVKTPGVGNTKFGQTRTFWYLSDLMVLRGYPEDIAALPDATVQMSLASTVAQLRARGYGEPL